MIGGAAKHIAERGQSRSQIHPHAPQQLDRAHSGKTPKTGSSAAGKSRHTSFRERACVL